MLTATLTANLREAFEATSAKKIFRAGDVAAGREFVAAYVQFLHAAERAFEAAKTAAPKSEPHKH
jgi:thioredoxin reductase